MKKNWVKNGDNFVRFINEGYLFIMINGDFDVLGNWKVEKLKDGYNILKEDFVFFIVEKRVRIKSEGYDCKKIKWGFLE